MSIDRRHLGLGVLSMALPALGGSHAEEPGPDGLALLRAQVASLCSSSLMAEREAAAGLRQVATEEPDTLRYQGTHILTHGAMRELARGFSTSTGQTLRVLGGGCDDALLAVSRGDAHLGGLCCAAQSTPARAWRSVLLAWDLKAVVAHPSVRLVDIPLAQLRAIARGDLNNWARFGLPRRSIALVLRQHCPGFREPVRERLLGHDRPLEWPAHPIFVDRDEQIVQTVARFEGSLGVVSLVFARQAIDTGQVRLLSVDGIHPNPSARRPTAYPLLGPLELIYQRTTPAAALFLRYAASAQGRAILAREFIPAPTASVRQADAQRA